MNINNTRSFSKTANAFTSKLIPAIVAGLIGIASSGAQAQSVTFTFNYLATGLTGDFALASGGTATPVGTLTLTDLSDLSLGDGKTGVRSTLSLNGLNQFSAGVGSIFVASYEINFLGTSIAGTPNWRNVAGVSVTNIEFEENGRVCGAGSGGACGTTGWGAASIDPSWEQEINFAAGTFTNGSTSTIDFLNDSVYGDFSVANLLANPVKYAGGDQPDAYAWIRIRSLSGGIATGDNGKWWEPAVFNANGGRLDVLSVVPEPETYGMILAGLGLMGFVAARRRQA